MIPTPGDLLFDLVKTDSPTGEEEKISELLINLLDDFSADSVYKDSVGNVIAKYDGSGIRVLVCGHMDTVPGKLEVSRVDGTISGRGAVDAKGSLASLLIGVERAKSSGFKGEIIFASVVGEEGPSKGIQNISSQIPICDFAVFGEPSNGNDITVGYRGRILMKIAFETGTHHASAPWMGEDAVSKALKVWEAIRNRFGNEGEFRRVSASLTRIVGGNADNMTPATCEITMDIRFPPSRKQNELTSEILELVTSEIGSNGWKSTILSSVDPYVSPLKSEVVTAFSESIQSHLGKRASMLFKSGSGDMNILGNDWKIPAITYGPGDPKQSHSNREEINISEVEASSAIVCDALLRLEKNCEKVKMS